MISPLSLDVLLPPLLRVTAHGLPLVLACALVLILRRHCVWILGD